MLTSDQKIKINEKVQGFKEAADFLPHGVFTGSYGDVPGVWVYAA